MPACLIAGTPDGRSRHADEYRDGVRERLKFDWRRVGWLSAATLLLGSLIGAGAGLLTLLLYGVEHLMLGYRESAAMPGPFVVPPWRRAAAVTAPANGICQRIETPLG